MNHSLAALLIEQGGQIMHWHPETTTTAGMAADGTHPRSEGYAARADGLSRRILAEDAPETRSACATGAPQKERGYPPKRVTP